MYPNTNTDKGAHNVLQFPQVPLLYTLLLCLNAKYYRLYTDSFGELYLSLFQSQTDFLHLIRDTRYSNLLFLSHTYKQYIFEMIYP